MAKKSSKTDQIIDAALRLAESRDWRDVRMADIAAETGMSLAEIADHVDGKADILVRFSRRIDRDLLKAIEKMPPEGEAHDRLFDIVMQRLELMTPWKTAIGRIVRDPATTPADWAVLAGSALTSQGWVLAAAGLEDEGVRGAAKLGGLALAYARVLRVWADDDDPGLARTMADLDRRLRDGGTWLKRLEAPMALATALGGIARAFRAGRMKPATGPERPTTGNEEAAE